MPVAPIPHAEPDANEPTTVILEDGVVPRRVRRPIDLARFVLALVISAGVVLVAWLATGTAEGLEDDIVSGASKLPSLVVLALNVIGGIGTLGLPIAVAIDLIVRRRLRQLFDGLAALLIALIVLAGLSAAVASADLPQIQAALSGSTHGMSTSTAPVLGGLVAFATVCRLLGRRPWNVLAIVVIGSIALVTVLSSNIALAGVVLSIFLGWAIGLITRYAVGTPTTRPTGPEIAAALGRSGYSITVLRAQESTSRGRRYFATTTTGTPLIVTVLDRDFEGAGLARAIWTGLRLRDDSTTATFNMRTALDHETLISLASQNAHCPTPKLLVTTEVSSDSSLLAHEWVPAERFADAGATQDSLPLSDDDLRQAWLAITQLHSHQVSHRSLTARHLLRDTQGKVWLIGGSHGAVAAGDVAMRIDIAEMLCTLAMLTSVDRAIDSARATIGEAELLRALPALQPVALTRTTRTTLRKHKGLLVSLRDRLLEVRPGAQVEQIQFERFKTRTLVMVIVGSIAGYVLLSQLAEVDLLHLMSQANYWWVLAALLFSLVTYVGAAWSLSGFVPEHLPLHRTVLAQLAGDFATLVSPPTIGALAINIRFLQKAGLHPALAGASVGVSQVMAFVFHILLLFGFGIAAGTQSDFTFDPPQWVVIGVVAIALVALGLLAVPAVRRLIAKRVGPLLKEVGPRMVTVAQRPLKLLEGIGGILLLNLAYIAVLYACVVAFGGQMAFAVVAVVYLAGATIGQAAPTPGGLGAVEAALAAGLTAGGLDGGLAVSAVLVYRLVTFWLPTIPGYWAFNWLTKKGAL